MFRVHGVSIMVICMIEMALTWGSEGQFTRGKLHSVFNFCSQGHARNAVAYVVLMVAFSSGLVGWVVGLLSV